jgi:hypothetical protein
MVFRLLQYIYAFAPVMGKCFKQSQPKRLAQTSITSCSTRSWISACMPFFQIPYKSSTLCGKQLPFEYVHKLSTDIYPLAVRSCWDLMMQVDDHLQCTTLWDTPHKRCQLQVTQTIRISTLLANSCRVNALHVHRDRHEHGNTKYIRVTSGGLFLQACYHR